MFSVYVNGSFCGSFQTAAEAMKCVDERARPFSLSWEIKDPFNNTYAKG